MRKPDQTYTDICRAGLLLPGTFVLCIALGGCGLLTANGDAEPEPESTVAEVKPVDEPPYEPSAESVALVSRYQRVESDLRAQGLLRTNGGGPDALFDAEDLSRNFLRIALFDEFTSTSGRFVARETASPLRRFEDPVRISLRFGASVSEPAREIDIKTVTTLVARLATATSHPISVTGGGGNFLVYVVDEDERRAIAPELRREFPGISDAVLQTVIDMPPSTFCLAIAFSGDDAPSIYRKALAIIRTEHPPLLRKACFHEEIAQGMGLANDSPSARPSIFNDDEEFALLTRQDELMLTILYDPRLAPGTTAPEAKGIVDMIARELLPLPAAELAALSNPEEL